MISLKIEEYCQNCKIFEPKVLKKDRYYIFSPVSLKCDFEIFCKHREKCALIRESIQEVKNENHSSKL